MNLDAASEILFASLQLCAPEIMPLPERKLRSKVRRTDRWQHYKKIETLSKGVDGLGERYSNSELENLVHRLSKQQESTSSSKKRKLAATAAHEAFGAVCIAQMPQLPHGARILAGAAPAQSERDSKGAVDSALEESQARKLLQVSRGDANSVGSILSGCVHIKVVCPRVFQAMIFCSPESLYAEHHHEVILRRIVVYGISEELDDKPFTGSSHGIFRRLSEHAAAAVEQMRPPLCTTPLPTLLFWLESYQDLFTAGAKLALQSAEYGFLPPTKRAFRIQR